MVVAIAAEHALALHRATQGLRDAPVHDGLVLLGASGPLAFAIRVGNQLQAIGRPGTVQAAQGTNVQRIDGLAGVSVPHVRAKTTVGGKTFEPTRLQIFPAIHLGYRFR